MFLLVWLGWTGAGSRTGDAHSPPCLSLPISFFFVWVRVSLALRSGAHEPSDGASDGGTGWRWAGPPPPPGGYGPPFSAGVPVLTPSVAPAWRHPGRVPTGVPARLLFFFFFAAPAVSPFLAVCGARARDTATPQGRGSTSWPLAGASSLAAPSTRTFLAAHVYPLRRGAAAPRRHRRGRLVRVVRVPMGGGSSRPPLRLARVPPPVSCPPARPFRRRPPARLHVRPLARRCCAPPPLRADHHGCPFPFVAPSGSPPPRRH